MALYFNESANNSWVTLLKSRKEIHLYAGYFQKNGFTIFDTSFGSEAKIFINNFLVESLGINFGFIACRTTPTPTHLKWYDTICSASLSVAAITVFTFKSSNDAAIGIL